MNKNKLGIVKVSNRIFGVILLIIAVMNSVYMVDLAKEYNVNENSIFNELILRSILMFFSFLIGLHLSGAWEIMFKEEKNKKQEGKK